MLLVYQGWTGTAGGKTYNTDRVWGKMDPNPGIAEGRQPTAYSSRPAASIVRGLLVLPEATSHKPQAACWLLDISGRKVLDLMPGANDIRALAPGVYFVRSEPSAASREPLAVTKVVVTR
jgi:hypothetical protein